MGRERGSHCSSYQCRAILQHATSSSATVSAPPRLLGASERAVAGGKLTISSYLNSDGSATLKLDANHIPDSTGLALHWAVSTSPNSPHEWSPPPPEMQPAGTYIFADGKAARSAFTSGILTITVPRSLVETPTEDGGPATAIGILVRCSQGQEEQWLHAEDEFGDLEAPLRPPPPPPPPGVGARLLANRVASEEAAGGKNLFSRYCMVNDSIGEACDDPSPHSMAVLLAWLRLNNARQLPWYDGGNYQGKDMCHMQRVLAVRMSDAALGDGLKAHIARMCLATLPRGGGEGDAIRMTILDLLRNNGIKEGHRPGIECAFLAQWHQKLHSNTTKDDIAIAEAYLHFLHTGMWDDFWWFLWEHYKLSRDDLAGMKAGWRTQGIVGPATHLPFLIPAVQHLLWVLRVTHSGVDLDTSMTMARGCLAGDLQWDVDDLLAHRDEWWVPAKILNIRERLSPVWRGIEDGGSRRSVLLLDISLESFLRTRIEAQLAGIDHMPRDDAAALLELALNSHCVSSGCTPEVANAAALLRKLLHAPPDSLACWTPEWSLHATAVLDHCSLAVAHFLDTICSMVQTPATIFKDKVSTIDSKYIDNFGEEVSRGHPLFVASVLLQRLRAECRTIAGLGPWEVASSGTGSNGATVGRVVVGNLADMQGQTEGSDPLVVVSPELGGLEDIPGSVVGILTASPVDLLSHIAIRARNGGVLLASCSDTGSWSSLLAELGAVGDCVSVSTGPGPGDLAVYAVDSAASAPGQNTSLKSLSPAFSPASIGVDDLYGAASVSPKLVEFRPGAVSVEEFRPSWVGGKSMGVQQLAELAASQGYSVPPAFALPYGTFESAVRESPRELQQRLEAALAELKTVAPASKDLDIGSVRNALNTVRESVMDIPLPQSLQEEIAVVVSSHNGASAVSLEGWASICDDTGSSNGVGESTGEPSLGADAWRAIKAVWASKWTERAFLNRRTCGMLDDDLHMAVLCMNVVPAEYAFVLHTESPLKDGSPEDVYGEVVVGLGETLVGNSPGRALTFRASKASRNDIELLSLPSKLEARFAPSAGTCLIARSDSNGEDLEGFAGAGLYESHMTTNAVVSSVNYEHERLLWDHSFKINLVHQLVEVAKGVQEQRGCAQDIEGCISSGKIYLLQSRSQVSA